MEQVKWMNKTYVLVSGMDFLYTIDTNMFQYGSKCTYSFMFNFKPSSVKSLSKDMEAEMGKGL